MRDASKEVFVARCDASLTEDTGRPPRISADIVAFYERAGSVKYFDLDLFKERISDAVRECVVFKEADNGQ